MAFLVELGHEVLEHVDDLDGMGDVGGEESEAGDVCEEEGGLVEFIGEFEFDLVVLEELGEDLGDKKGKRKHVRGGDW